jgi:uncharacterized membrane protein YadS
LFIVVAAFNSFHLLPKAVVDMLVTLDTVLLAMAMAALGTDNSRQRPEKSRRETAADGTGIVHSGLSSVAAQLTSRFTA